MFKILKIVDPDRNNFLQFYLFVFKPKKRILYRLPSLLSDAEGISQSAIFIIFI